MKLKRLLSVLDVCECTADPELDVRDISFDSRTTQPGDLFAAVCGYESDGHRFIGAAVERGAAKADAAADNAKREAGENLEAAGKDMQR